VLAGTEETVTRVIRCRNAAEDPRVGRLRRAAATGFVIDPLELRDLFDDLERAGERVLAYYHSHPVAAQAEPSHTDVSDARSSGEHRSALFVIAHGSDLAAFAIGDSDVQRVEIVAA
jgi:proteasome lid subunit RPN8/RPN11